MKKWTKKIPGIFAATFILLVMITAFFVLSPYVYFPGFVKYDKNDYETGKVTIYSAFERKTFDLGKKCTAVNLNDMRGYVYGAFVSVEDKRFFEHKGVDFKRVAGALVKDVFSGGFNEGGSTITQQLVKNVALSSEKSLTRKINEIKLAQMVEKDFSKEKILEKYLNTIYYGNGIYGIDNAAKYYFAKDVGDLTPAEAATLAAVINNPAAFDPLKNTEKCLKRRNKILKLMKDQGFIDEKQCSAALTAEILIRNDEYFVDHYAAAILNESKNKFRDLSGFALTSNEDKDITDKVKRIIENEADEGYVSALIARNDSGKVLARVSTFPYDISAARFMPGSLIKPMLCYAPLLESGKIYTCSPIADEKTDFSGYAPSNYGDIYEGNITQSRALAISSNIAAIKNFISFGPRNAVAFAAKAGVNFDENDYENYATALGALRKGLTLDEILSLYLCVASGGKRVEPSYINCAVKNGNTLYAGNKESYPVMGEDTAFLLSSMMRECVTNGTAKTLKRFDNVCAKTGTVGDKRGNSECFCAAFSPRYTVLCHISKKDKPLPLSITGGTRPTKIVKRIFEMLDDEEEITPPDSIKKYDIDLNEWKKGNVVLAADNEKTVNKKSCCFSERFLPPKRNSFEDFFDDYLRYLNDFDRSYGFVDQRVKIGDLG